MRQAIFGISIAAWVAGAVGCLSSDEHLEGHKWRCEESTDCGSGYQCDTTAGYCVAAYNNENGVFDDRIKLGMIGVTNPKDPTGLYRVGLAAVDGQNIYISQVNRLGGVFGRKLELEVRNDDYDPEITAKFAEEFMSGSDREVFALSIVLGTAPSMVAADLAQEYRVIFFSPGTGVDSLEPDPPRQYVFNVRLRYSEEADVLTEHMTTVAIPRVNPHNVATFVQGTSEQGKPDPFGASGVVGVQRALERQGVAKTDIPIATYDNADKADMVPAVARLLPWMAHEDRADHAADDGTIQIGIPMSILAGPGANFVEEITNAIATIKRGEKLDSKYGTFDEDQLGRLEKIQLNFATLSTVGQDLVTALQELGGYKDSTEGALKQYGAGTLFASPVPDVRSEAKGVDEYLTHLAAYNEDNDTQLTPNPFSLEGYLVSKLFVEGLKKHGPDLTTESFRDTLETLEVNLGTGTTYRFSPDSHQALSKMWGLQLDDELELKDIGVLLQED